MKEKLAQIDIRIVLIVLLIAVSTGHVGRVFADREAMSQWQIGYLLALAVDGVLAVALYEIAYAKEKKHKLLALGGFMAACGISGGFNVYYYRLFHPTDPIWTSILLGMTAPTMAAFLALLKSKGDVARQETESQLEFFKFQIQQEEETKRTVAIAREKTEQSKELTKRKQMLAKEKAVKQVVKEAETARELTGKLVGLCDNALAVLRAYMENPDLSLTAVAKQIGIDRKLVSYHKGKLADRGLIHCDNGRVRALVNREMLETYMENGG